MKNIATYNPSVEELTDKIRHIVDNYMFENKTDQANITSFAFEGREYDKVKIFNVSGKGKEIGFVPMQNPDAEPLMLSFLICEQRQYGKLSLLVPYFSCRSLFNGEKVKSTVGTHQFMKGEDISSIYKDLYGDFKVLMVKKERSLLHPFGREAVTLRDIKNTDSRPFKIYPSEMKDVSITVKPRISSYAIFGEVNKDLNELALKDFDIELADYIVLSAKDFNPNIDNQYSSDMINMISVRNGQLASFRMKDTHEISCLSKSGLEKVEKAVKDKMIYLRKFTAETTKEQECERLFEKTRELQDKLAQLPGMEVGKKITLDKGIPLDDNVVVDSIGDMVVNDVTYVANSDKGAVFIVSDGEREIPFSRMMEWNQEQVAEAVMEKIDEDLSVNENAIKAIQELMDEQHTDKIELPRPFGVESKPFGQEATAVVRDKSGNISLSDGKNTLSIDLLPNWQVNELVNMVYEKPLHDLLKDGETVKFKLTADNSMSSGYQVDDYLFDSITKYGEALGGGGVRNILSQNGQQSSKVFSNFPIGCTKQVYDAVKPIIEKRRAEEKTHDSLEYDGKKWPVRSVVLPSTGEEVLIGTVALEQALLPDDGHSEWKDRKAQAVDERIFYYVTEEEFNFPAELLAAIVEREALDVDVAQNSKEEVNLDNQEEERLLSDEDIEKQYSDYKVTGIKFYKQVQPDAWSGVVDLKFPNASHPDFNETMVNPFISYDKEGKKIAFDNWMPDDVYKGVCGYIRQEYAKQPVVDAIIERTTDAGAKAFTAEQQQVILNFLNTFDTVDKKLQALSPLWERADSDREMSSSPDEWKADVKAELNDLASGIVRENGQGLKV